MALQFNRGSSTAAGQGQTAPEGGTEVAVQPFNVLDERERLKTQLADTQELDMIVSKIHVHDPQTIVEFGSDVAEEIAKCSDTVLRSLNMNQINDSGELLNTLGKIMDQFDINEIADDRSKGLLGKLFSNMKKQLDQILAKYHTMGDEVDKIYVKLKQYEAEIKDSNKKLEDMFQTNLNYYQQLVKYIMAGEQGVKEVDAYLTEMQEEYAKTGDTTLQFDITSLEQAKMMLEQRTHDLRIAENVAMQSIPMLKMMQFSNLNLVRKINSAFIITLPVFKQALSQAILLKRQKIQAEAMSALDERTNEMLLKNAQNTAAQSKLTTELASGSSVKIETLEQTFKTIMDGIDETKRIQDEARRKQEEEVARLQNMKNEFNNKFQSNLQ